MTERKADHDPSSDAPGAVSNQNREDNQSEHRDDGTHPEPRTSGESPKEREPRHPTEGAAGEGSQSTGHRQNAG